MLYTWSDRGDLKDHDHYFTGTSVSYDFTYNGVGQVESKMLSDPSFGWVAPTTGTDAYLVNGLNQYTDIDGVSPVHNTNGNLESDHLGRGFSYDAENVLRSVTGLTGGSATYRYHADGSRREKTHNGTTSTFYYMGGLGYLDEGDTAFVADQEIAFTLVLYRIARGHIVNCISQFGPLFRIHFANSRYSEQQTTWAPTLEHEHLSSHQTCCSKFVVRNATCTVSVI